jgi:hypothetical protein
VIPTRREEIVTASLAQEAREVRWQVEDLPRGVKPLTGSQRCPCRRATPWPVVTRAGGSLKVKAKPRGQPLYQVQARLLTEYLRAELRHPRIPACLLYKRKSCYRKKRSSKSI